MPNFMFRQIQADLLAILAFAPVSLCIGYAIGFFTNLYNFRSRSIAERFIWSIAISISVSPILAYVFVYFSSITAAVTFFLLCTLVSILCVGKEGFEIWRTRRFPSIGLRPYGGLILCLALVWVAFVILSLIDLQSGEQLFTPLQYWDHAYRVSWINSILIGGVPPPNLGYQFHQPAPMRNYYFWYVTCATIARGFHLPARAVLSASCVWIGLGLSGIAGLYLKHLLVAGVRLRKQFVIANCLFVVGGLDICVLLWDLLVAHKSFPIDTAMWSPDPILSWNYSLLWSPHHIAGLISCMFAFLLGSISREKKTQSWLELVLIGFALASSFGVSIFVPLSFFLIMCGWSCYRIAVERDFRSPLIFLKGGVVCLILCSPFVWQLIHSSSKLQNGSVLTLAIRRLLPAAQRNAETLGSRVIELCLLPPGFAVLLGFHLLAFIYLLWLRARHRDAFSQSHRTLLTFCLISFPIISFIRSGVLTSDDYGYRAPYILQFCLILVGSEMLVRWSSKDAANANQTAGVRRYGKTMLRLFTYSCLGIGILTSLTQAFFYRFDVYLISLRGAQYATSIAHDPYLLTKGFEELNKAISPGAVVQANPSDINRFRETTQVMNNPHQTAISYDHPWCGSELGGDPAGCSVMAPRIDRIFRRATASEAQSVCRDFGIDFLVAEVNDAIWSDRGSWVWSLKAVVAQPEFRALGCK